MFAAVYIPNFSLQAVLRHETELEAGQPSRLSQSRQSSRLSKQNGHRERTTTRRVAGTHTGRRPAPLEPAPLRFLEPQPVALVDPELSRPTIVQLNGAARAQGVCEGLTASQAMARCGGLKIKSRSLAQEEAATGILLQTAYAFSPNIESTASGVCTLELKRLGLQFHNGTAETWAQKLLEALGQLHLDAHIGFAVTPELALLAAQSARPILMLQTGAPQRAGTAHCHRLESFPLSTLAPPPEILDILQRWGIKTVGAFLALGKDRVSERLGPAAAALFERVSPNSVRPLKLVFPPEEFAEQMEFPGEVERLEPLLLALRGFVEQLASRLDVIYLVIAELQLQLGLASGERYEHTFKIPAPTTRVETLVRMLQTHLESVRADSPITSLRLSAQPCQPDRHQFGLFETTLRNPNRFSETVAGLTGLCGAKRAGTPQLQPTHRPDAFQMKAPSFDAAAQREVHATSRQPQNKTANTRSRVVKEIAASLRESMTEMEPTPRGLPLRRFRPAVSAQIEFREQQPVSLGSSVFSGTIVEARGPFRSSGNWWDASRWARDEWDVQTGDGELYRIFRSPEGCFVEGVYD